MNNYIQGSPLGLDRAQDQDSQGLKRHMIHPKAKAWTNIPLCCMISMLVVRPALKIDVLKMEHVFQMGYQEGDKVFYVSPTN